MSAKTRKIREQKASNDVYSKILITMLGRYPTKEEYSSLSNLIESGLIILKHDPKNKDGIWFAINTGHPLYDEFIAFEKNIANTVKSKMYIKDMKETIK